MTDKPKKRIYEEDLEDVAGMRFKNIDKNPIVESGVSDKSVKEKDFSGKPENLLDKVRSGADKATRAIDSFTNPEFKDYKITSAGRENLSQFSDRELKFLNRDYRIEGRDNSEVVNEIKSRKIDIKAINISAEVNTVYQVKTDKGDVSLGVSKKTGEAQISEANYKENPNIKVWRKLEEGDLSKSLINKGELSSFEVKNDLRNLKGAGISSETVSRLNNEIYSGIDRSQARNTIIKLDSKSLSDPIALRGKIVENNTGEKFNVLAADSRNLTVQKLTGKDVEASLINIKTERNNSIAIDTQLTGILDRNTVMGHNHKTNETYMGVVGKDKSVEWKTQNDYLAGLQPEVREKTISRLEDGDFRLNNAQAVGRVDGGNILYAADKGNNEMVITANQKDWVKVDGTAGKALLSMAGIDATALKTMLDVNVEHSQTRSAGFAMANESLGNLSKIETSKQISNGRSL